MYSRLLALGVSAVLLGCNPKPADPTPSLPPAATEALVSQAAQQAAPVSFNVPVHYSTLENGFRVMMICGGSLLSSAD